MKDPRLLAAPGCVGVYHLCSRVVDKRFVIKQREKVRFMELARGGAAFAGVDLLSWCVMDNHFHLLVRVPPVDADQLEDEEVLERLKHLYSENKCEYLREVWRRCGNAQARGQFLAPFRARIGNLSDFMKTLKQRFSQWYNRCKCREGTLWEGRFRSVLLEHEEGDRGLGPLVRFVAGYIDLNPVRAKMVSRAENSSWNGFGSAVRGDALALAGLRLLWGEDAHKRGGSGGLIEKHRLMLEKDEPLGSMAEHSTRRPTRKRGLLESGEAQIDKAHSDFKLIYGLSPGTRMSCRCPEVSRARILGQPGREVGSSTVT